jgi:hypothetical protein
MPLDASAVAKLLHEFGQRTALRGGNPYRARAYSRAALGHLTGRQLLRRPGYEVDIDTVLEACARHGVAVEVNSNAWRLDLDWRGHQRALEPGCMTSINPDAHYLPYPLGRRNGTKRRCTTGSRAQLSRAIRLYPIPGGTTSESEKHSKTAINVSAR